MPVPAGRVGYPAGGPGAGHARSVAGGSARDTRPARSPHTARCRGPHWLNLGRELAAALALASGQARFSLSGGWHGPKVPRPPEVPSLLLAEATGNARDPRLLCRAESAAGRSARKAHSPPMRAEDRTATADAAWPRLLERKGQLRPCPLGLTTPAGSAAIVKKTAQYESPRGRFGH